MADENRLNSILCKFDADWMASDEARTEATNDLYFSRVSQWDDWLSNYTTLQYRGQFDVVRPVVRKLVAEMRRNPIDVLFRPKDGANPDAADVLIGMYRTDMRHNTAKIAVNVGVREQIESGVGAWRLVTQYEDNDPTSNNQVIRRLPIHEACSHVIWDANSKQMDKSDAKHCTVINALSRNGWKEFAEDYGIDPDTLPSFQNPNDTWLFPWVSNDVVYVAEYYEVEEKKEKVFIYRDPLTGEPVSYYQQDIKDVIDDLANRGFIKVSGQMNNYQNLANIGLGALQGQANAGQTYANNMSQISQQSAALAAANANRPSALQQGVSGAASGALLGGGIASALELSTPWGAGIGAGLGLLGSLF